ncbi:hypothetical protein ABSL23_17430 (plasmid) [Halobacterium sp. NMX12-1]|uniref:CopG family transcriptional regulator n=1 Tax=Halobacterium sp. NMX12-1 TaxID=3166650 RepID=A0AAU8CHH1_9EURY
MGQTVSFVARDELAEWLESRADEEMKSVSAVCQDIVAAEYRRQNPVDTGKGGETEADESEADEPDALESDREFSFGTKREADAVRTQFPDYISDDDDKRFNEVVVEEGTPGEVVKELERRSVS